MSIKNKLNKSKTKILVIGQGSIGVKHAQNAANLSKDVFVSVLSRRSDLVDITNYMSFSTIDEALEWEPNIIILANEASLRFSEYSLIANTSALIILEKPISGTLEDALAIKAIAKRRMAPTFVAYNLRFSGGLKIIERVLAEERIGNLCHVSAIVGQDLQTWRPNRAVENTVSSSKALGGGVVRELSHEIDILNYLFKRLVCNSAVFARTKYTHFDVEDVAHLAFRSFKDQNVFPISLIMDFIRCQPKREIEFIGETGTLVWNLLAGTVELFKKDGSVSVEYNQENDLLQTQKLFWEAVYKGDFSRFCTISEAVQVMMLISRAEILAEEFKWL